MIFYQMAHVLNEAEKPDIPSSKNDCQSECAGIYFKSKYLINGTAFPGTRYSLLFCVCDAIL